LFKYGTMRGRYQIDKETRIYAASDAVAAAAKNRFKITGDIQAFSRHFHSISTPF